MAAEERMTRAARVRKTIAEHGPITRGELCRLMGIGPSQKGTQGAVMATLRDALSRGWVVELADGTLVEGDVSRIGVRRPPSGELAEGIIARRIIEEGPATMTELADAVGMTVANVRIHVTRICENVGRAPDGRSALYGLRRSWWESVPGWKGREGYAPPLRGAEKNGNGRGGGGGREKEREGRTMRGYAPLSRGCVEWSIAYASPICFSVWRRPNRHSHGVPIPPWGIGHDKMYQIR